MTRELGRTGNASSLHGSGRAARKVVEESREAIAAAVGAHPSELIFTSGGTESDNLAVKGGYWAQAGRGPHRGGRLGGRAPRRARLGGLAGSGGRAPTCTGCPSTPTGRVREVDLDAVVGPRTALVSVMWANNEVGTLQPVAAVAARAAEHGALSHSDAVQAVGHVPVDFAASGLDLLTFTAHKLGGPYGVGALLARRERGPDRRAARRGTGARRPVRDPGRGRGGRVRGRRRGGGRAGWTATRPRCGQRCAGAGGRDHRRRPGRRRARPRRPGRPAARGGQRAVPGLLGRGPADAARRRRHRLLHRVGLLGRRGPAQPRAAGHGPGRDRRPFGAALLPCRQHRPPAT